MSPRQIGGGFPLRAREQRRFVLWWDGLKLNSLGNTTVSDREQYPDRGTIHRWRKKLKAGRDFDAALEAAQARCIRIAEFQRGATEQKGASGTGVSR